MTGTKDETMRVKLLLNIGTADAQRLGLGDKTQAGDEVDVPQHAADELLRLGWAAGPGSDAPAEGARPVNSADLTGVPASAVKVPASGTARITGAGEPPDLDGMTKAELQAYADERGIDVPSGATKAEIVAAIEEAETRP